MFTPTLRCECAQPGLIVQYENGLFNQATDSRKINTHRRSHRIDTAQCRVYVCVWFYVGSNYRPTAGLGDRTRGEHCYHFTSSTLDWPTFRSPIKKNKTKQNKTKTKTKTKNKKPKNKTKNTLYGRNYILTSNTINQHNLLWGGGNQMKKQAYGMWLFMFWTLSFEVDLNLERNNQPCDIWDKIKYFVFSWPKG